jgi:hypothetical protein
MATPPIQSAADVLCDVYIYISYNLVVKRGNGQFTIYSCFSIKASMYRDVH